ncbi:MAG: TonB-dependent receptor [Asticcacaulis sp.]
MRVTGGLRYTEDEIAARVDDGSVDGTTGTDVVLTAGTLQTGKYDKLTYKLGGEYDVSKQSMLYASYSTGFRSGGVDSNGGAYGPETVNAYEIGSKNQFFSNRLLINADAFYYLYSDYQLSYGIQIDGAAVDTLVVANVPGTSKVWGAEVEGRYLITPADKFDFAVSYEGSKFADVTLATSCGGGSCTYTDLGGNTLPRMPLWTVNGGYEHVFTLSGGSNVTAHLDGEYKSTYQADIIPFDGSRQKASTIWNARLTYAPAKANYSISAYVNNLTDRAVLQMAHTAGPVNRYGILNDPRTYGVILQAHF